MEPVTVTIAAHDGGYIAQCKQMLHHDDHVTVLRQAASGEDLVTGSCAFSHASCCWTLASVPTRSAPAASAVPRVSGNARGARGAWPSATPSLPMPLLLVPGATYRRTTSGTFLPGQWVG